jgi:CRISPR/Cas system-associated exonuclease Cas4 (RecB family)
MQSTIRNQQSSINNRQSPISFSQGSLQDYVDCRRRFQLRYLLRVAWPALEVEPVLENESAMQQGALFHRLIQQHLLGIPAERLTPLAKEEDDGTEHRISRWWQNYLALKLPEASARYPEVTLSMPFTGFRLVGKYDLIQIGPEGRATIYDWKTSRKRSKSSWLMERLQTRVYPYLLAQAGAHLNQGRQLAADQIEMIYWFAEAPSEPEVIPYSAEQFAKDEAYLQSLIAEITRLEGEAFGMTPQVERCRFCTYRSLCDRGVEAGDLDQMEAELEPASEPEFDFDQIGEIAF